MPLAPTERESRGWGGSGEIGIAFLKHYTRTSSILGYVPSTAGFSFLRYVLADACRHFDEAPLSSHDAEFPGTYFFFRFATILEETLL